jgi:hypothetical protein
MDYSIGTGFWAGTGWRGRDDKSKADFFNIWWNNNLKYANPKDVFIINPNSEIVPEEKKGQWINLSFNAGHVHDLDKNDNPNKKFGGWSLAFIQLAMLAYSNNTDLVFLEQDCITIGECIPRLYEEIKDKGMIFGRPGDSNGQSLEQSFFLIKHPFLLSFVQEYLNLNYNDAGPYFMRPEVKFLRILQTKFQNQWKCMDLGYGRARPKDWNEETYYLQQLKPEELLKLKEMGKIIC